MGALDVGGGGAPEAGGVGQCYWEGRGREKWDGGGRGMDRREEGRKEGGTYRGSCAARDESWCLAVARVEAWCVRMVWRVACWGAGEEMRGKEGGSEGHRVLAGCCGEGKGEEGFWLGFSRGVLRGRC